MPNSTSINSRKLHNVKILTQLIILKWYKWRNVKRCVFCVHAHKSRFFILCQILLSYLHRTTGPDISNQTAVVTAGEDQII